MKDEKKKPVKLSDEEVEQVTAGDGGTQKKRIRLNSLYGSLAMAAITAAQAPEPTNGQNKEQKDELN